jgi:hypothetical protein
MTQGNINLLGGQLARVYSLAVAYPDNVPGYVTGNKNAMEAECAEDCFGRYFVGCLRNHALSGPAPGDVSDRAMDIAARSGAPQLGPQLAQDFMRERTDMMLLAAYLEDMLRVIPDMLAGNDGSYQRTSVYTTMRFVWQNAGALVLPQFLQSLQQMTFELNEWYVNNLMDAVRFDYLERAWPRSAQLLKDTVEKYESARAEGNSVMILVQAAVIVGLTTKFAPLLGLTDDKIGRMSKELQVDPLIDWLRDNDWI